MESATPTTSIKEQLKKLLALQEVDKDFFAVNQQLIDKPAEVEALRQQFEAKKAKYHELEAKVVEMKMNRDSLELELKVIEEKVLKDESQLSMIKTNKEYQAKLIEIETHKADKDRVEEQILMSFDGMDEIQAQIEEEKKFLDGEEAKFNEEKEKVDLILIDLKQESDRLGIQVKELQKGIDSKILAYYQKISDNRDGIAIVPASSNSCGGCYMNIPLQTINAIKMYDQIVACDLCQRVLYLPEEL